MNDWHYIAVRKTPPSEHRTELITLQRDGTIRRDLFDGTGRVLHVVIGRHPVRL